MVLIMTYFFIPTNHLHLEAETNKIGVIVITDLCVGALTNEFYLH